MKIEVGTTCLVRIDCQGYGYYQILVSVSLENLYTSGGKYIFIAQTFNVDGFRLMSAKCDNCSVLAAVVQ